MNKAVQAEVEPEAVVVVEDSTTEAVESTDTNEFEAVDDLLQEVFEDESETSNEEATTEAETETSETEVTEETEGASDEQVAEETEETAAEEVEVEAEEEEVAPEEQEAQVLSPEEQAQQLAAYDAQAVEMLSKEVYALTEDQITELEDDIGVALPKMAANLHLQVMRAATAQITRLLPTMVQAVSQTQAQAKSLTQQFFDANAELAGHEEEVGKVGQVYRQLNPKASEAEFIRDVGALTMQRLGLEKAKVVAEKEAPKKAPPYKPAGPGASTSGAPVADDNVFSEMFEILDEEEG